MPERAALLIAVESYFEAASPIPYASADLGELARALPEARYRREKCFQITSHRTTKASLDSHLQRLPKLVGKVETLLVAIVARGFSHKGKGYLACMDTLTADPIETSLPIADLIAALHRTRCREIVVLLDADPLEMEGMEPGLNREELTKLFDDSPSCVGLLASEPGERSHESGTLRHGIWRHHVIEAFTGTARAALAKDGTLSAASLQAFLEEAVPRTARRTGDKPLSQTPVLFGEANAAVVVTDLSHLSKPTDAELLDPARLKRIVFRAETSGRIKDLAGFRKSHALPDRANDYAKKFLARTAMPDIQADLDATFDAIRDAFGYRRKDLDVSAERDGHGFLRAPDFDYSVSASIDPDDPSKLIWRREIGRLHDADFIRGEAFTRVFGRAFDRLVFEFAVPVDVAAFVDRIEDNTPEGIKVSAGSSGDTCEIAIEGFVGKVMIERRSLTIEGRSANSSGLLDQFLAFLAKFGPLGESKALVRTK